MFGLHCISLFMVPESIFLRDNNVGRYFSFVMWRPKKKIKIRSFVSPPGGQAVDPEGCCGTHAVISSRGLTCPHCGDREAGSHRDPARSLRIIFHCSAPSLPRHPAQPMSTRASQYHPFLWPFSGPATASMLGSPSLSLVGVSRSSWL